MTKKWPLRSETTPSHKNMAHLPSVDLITCTAYQAPLDKNICENDE
jgi:hypothetical protein